MNFREELEKKGCIGNVNGMLNIAHQVLDAYKEWLEHDSPGASIEIRAMEEAMEYLPYDETEITGGQNE